MDTVCARLHVCKIVFHMDEFLLNIIINTYYIGDCTLSSGSTPSHWMPASPQDRAASFATFNGLSSGSSYGYSYLVSG